MSGWLTSREEYLGLVAVYARKARRSIHAGDYWNARRNATQAVRCYRRAEQLDRLVIVRDEWKKTYDAVRGANND